MKSDLQLLFAGSDSAEVVIREGQALPLKEPLILNIFGVLDSPLKWLEKRVALLEQTECHIKVDRDELKIVLRMDETNHYCGTVTGSLELHPMFKLFGVNTSKSLSNFDMAKLIKMNRSAFETISVAMGLVTELQNFRAKVDKEIEKADNNRGDKKMLLAQTVESTLPDKFNLHMPIFKGTRKQTFEVEVYIDPNDFSCSLVSPVANDLVEEMRDSEIDKVLNAIRELAPDIAIIEE